jgi:hypothetical protein
MPDRRSRCRGARSAFESLTVTFGSTALDPAITDEADAFSMNETETVPSAATGPHSVKAKGTISFVSKKAVYTVN